MPERIPLIVDTSRLATLAASHSTAAALLAAYGLFEHRQCIGWRPSQQNGSSLADKYHWLTYAQVLEKAQGIGSGLQKIITDRAASSSFVGLLGAVTPSWLITDYACLIKGLPIVLMHRNTSAAQLSYMLKETKMAVLVSSKHFEHIVAAALALLAKETATSTGSIHAYPPPFVVWIEDAPEAYASTIPSF